MALGAPKLISVGGAKDFAKGLKAYCALDALDPVYQDAVEFPRYRRAAENIDSIRNSLICFAKWRKVARGGGRTFPDTFTAILRMEWGPFYA